MVPRILVVDDEPDVQELIRRRFRHQIRGGDLEFDFALDGEAALEQIKNDGVFDIVLSDINMPRMDGLTLLGHLREYGAQMKTIIVSAYGDMDNIRTAMNRGAFDFVTKPINFDDLAATIEKTLMELRYIRDLIHRMSKAEALKRDMERELEIGRAIQSGFLPQVTPEIDGWHIDPHFQSAREVAGDFYDVFAIADQRRIGLIVADVCDKGVGAALFMTLFRSLLRATAKQHEYVRHSDAVPAPHLDRPDLLLSRCVQFTNNYIASTHGHASMFATLFFGLLDPQTGDLHYINAGHEPPVILGTSGIREVLDVTGPVVGLFEDSHYRVGATSLRLGDTLFAYTDGVTDVVNGAGEAFGEPRMKEILQGDPGPSPTRAVLTAIDRHRGDAPPFDDITMLSVSRR